MGYISINNLYKDQTILLFKEVYALEKIHGSPANIRFDPIERKIHIFSCGTSPQDFLKLFDTESLTNKLIELFPTKSVIIYGEAYGGKNQGMSSTYGKELKFIGFDVLMDKIWLNVPDAENVCKQLNLEFVDYVRVSTDIHFLNFERDRPSIQAIRNECGCYKLREGVILRPLVEMILNNGERVIAKHKRDEFRETKTPRNISPEKLKIIEDAKTIADEWVTENRLIHVLDKLPQDINIENTPLVINAMISDVYKEAKDEIIESKEVSKSIGRKTAILFKKFLQNRLGKMNE